jgi:membrane protein implicated in regulation of membrane protease activity
MYGRWFLYTFGIAALVLFALGLVLTAYVPFFAVAIAFLIAAGVVWGRAARRTSQVGSERSSAAQERREAGQGARPSASPAPRSGEGTAGEAQRARVTGRGVTGRR